MMIICLHTVIYYQEFLSNTNNLYTVIYFQVFLSNNNNNLHTDLFDPSIESH